MIPNKKRCAACAAKDELIDQLWRIAHDKVNIIVYNKELAKIRAKIIQYKNNK